MEPQMRQAEHAADTRRALVDAARRLFSKRGYSAASLDDVCQRARVTKGALYHHFWNKEDLFAAVLEQVEGEFVEAGSAEVDPGADVWEKLRAAGGSFLDACTRPNARRIVLEAPAVLGWKRCREIEGEYVVRLMRAALEQAVRDGLLRSDHPEVLAQLLVALFNEASMIVAGAGDPEVAREAASRELDAIIAGLKYCPRNCCEESSQVPLSRRGTDPAAGEPSRGDHGRGSVGVNSCSALARAVAGRQLNAR